VNPADRSGVYQAMRTQLPVHDPPVAYATPTEFGPTDPVGSEELPPESIDLTVVNVDTPRDFEAFYREAYTDIARALTATLGDFDLAQEATDEAMVRAYVRWDKIRAYDNPGGWVYRRRVTRALPFHERRTVDPPTTDPAHFAALHDLDISLRAVVVCRLLLDWSVDETAAALRLKAGTVKSRLHRALAQLERTLGEDS
jgi:DNA-directed RNA polymerase specialized sigma24 family protein